MIRGIASGVMAMRAQVLNQEVIANNLANAGTAAFNKDKAVFKSFGDVLMFMSQPSGPNRPIGDYTAGTLIRDVRTIRDVGPMETTGNPMDLALPGGEYLSVETSSGIRYTRRGDVQVDADGFLRVGGFKLLGDSGALQLQSGRSCRILEDGSILNGETLLGALRIVKILNEDDLDKEGNSLFKAEPANTVPVDSPSLLCGALEKSSVDPVTEMISLIQSMRSYEAAQRAIKAEDEALERAINRVGSV